eukprot:gnl/TRDRNA2_/TRDRNA2_38109_c0_seq1.p1 gnl/TRDRNA2_/TRDRNA2_38109_c0~~gnl/TRDRNA2_/TRDRNA2_38109_c0_seq1.p1  ORF type:complete len:338 (+),score=60.74 gnl/TRDRNA2_/TRDRNA2_38109_c0_seq1:53-1066(+)
MPLIGLSIEGRYAVGVVLSFLNSALSSLGFTLQRKSHLESERAGSKETEGRLQLLWVVGVALYTTASLPDVVAYTLVPQMVCSTVACLRLVMVTLLSFLVLNERFRLRELFGMLLCSLGATCCLWFGPSASRRSVVSPEELLNARVVVYMAVAGCVLLGLAGLEYTQALCGYLPHRVKLLILPLCAALADNLEKVLITSIGFVRAPYDLLDGRWLLMAVTVVLLALMALYFNLQGVKTMPVKVFVPLAFAICIALQFFQASVILGEFDELAPHYAILSMLGAFAALCGALLISPPEFERSQGGSADEKANVDIEQPQKAKVASSSADRHSPLLIQVE